MPFRVMRGREVGGRWEEGRWEEGRWEGRANLSSNVPRLHTVGTHTQTNDYNHTLITGQFRGNIKPMACSGVWKENPHTNGGEHENFMDTDYCVERCG